MKSKEKRAEYERDRRKRQKESGLADCRLLVLPENNALLKALQSDMRGKRIVNVIFEGEE